MNRENLLLCVYVNDIRKEGKTQNVDPMWKILMKDVDLGEPTSFLDHVNSGRTQRECQTSEGIVDKYRDLFGSRMSVGGVQELLYSETSEANISHGLTIWKVMQRNAWTDIANLQKRLNNYTESQLNVLATVNSKKKKWDLLENCQKYHKLF